MQAVAKHRRSDLRTGVHLVSISDLSFLRNAAKEIIKVDGFAAIVVKFTNKTGTHEQMYICDGSYRQKYFSKMLADAGVVVENGKNPHKDAIVGKKLYVAVQEVHRVDNEKVVFEDGEPLIEYHIFKTAKYDETFAPRINGDPLTNNGIASGDFVSYRNIASLVKHKTSESNESNEPTF